MLVLVILFPARLNEAPYIPMRLSLEVLYLASRYSFRSLELYSPFAYESDDGTWSTNKVNQNYLCWSRKAIKSHAALKNIPALRGNNYHKAHISRCHFNWRSPIHWELGIRWKHPRGCQSQPGIQNDVIARLENVHFNCGFQFARASRYTFAQVARIKSHLQGNDDTNRGCQKCEQKNSLFSL